MSDAELATPPSQLVDVKGVASLLRCAPRTVYRLSDAGKMPQPLRLGSLVRWRLTGPGSIQEWLDAGCPAVRKAGAR